MMLNHSYNPSPTIRGEVAADIAAPAMLAVKIDSNGKFALPKAGDFCIGIVLADTDDVKSGDPISVQIKDGTYWMAGGTFSRGAMLAADETGKAVAASAGDNVVAVALGDGASGKPVEVIICHTIIPQADA